jgi:hypothetical protein
MLIASDDRLFGAPPPNSVISAPEPGSTLWSAEDWKEWTPDQGRDRQARGDEKVRPSATKRGESERACGVACISIYGWLDCAGRPARLFAKTEDHDQHRRTPIGFNQRRTSNDFC